MRVGAGSATGERGGVHDLVSALRMGHVEDVVRPTGDGKERPEGESARARLGREAGEVVDGVSDQRLNTVDEIRQKQLHFADRFFFSFQRV